MPNAADAKLEYEAGQVVVSTPTELSDSGDHTTFDSGASLFSGRAGYEASILPNGLKTGGVVSPAASASNDVVDVAALTCNLNGVAATVAADTDIAITRPATDVAKINSITVNASGAIAVVAGTDGTGATFSDTRGAAGGPPLIPVDSIEIAQVRVTSATAGAVADSEIYAVVGVHTEMANYPLFETSNVDGSVTFLSALPLVHTASVPKKVFGIWATPIFAEASDAYDYVPPETSHSVSSQQVYGRTVGSTSSSLNQGGFKALLQDGISDGLVSLKNENLWFRFFPSRYKSVYQLAQGLLGMKRAFPAGGNIMGDFTITAENDATEVA